jgi:hypothetical protein
MKGTIAGQKPKGLPLNITHEEYHIFLNIQLKEYDSMTKTEAYKKQRCHVNRYQTYEVLDHGVAA